MSESELDSDGLEYYYVTYSALGLIACGAIIRQRRVFGRPPGDFNIAGAMQYLHKLLDSPVIIQNWHLVSRKRAYEINQFAESVMKDLTGDKKTDNVRHLRIVPTDKKEETPTHPWSPDPMAKLESIALTLFGYTFEIPIDPIIFDYGEMETWVMAEESVKTEKEVPCEVASNQKTLPAPK